MNTENNRIHGGSDAGSGGSGSGAPEGCGAHELKGLLHQIADHLADSDRRQSKVLDEMHDRLAALGHEARAVRHRVPAEYMPAFERVEEGMSLLADRIAHAVSAAKQSAASAPFYGASASEAASPAIPPHVIMHSVVQPAAPVEVAAPHSYSAHAAAAAPAALRSAAPAAAPAAPAEMGVDPFDMVDRVVPETEHTWDREQAEALARVYETPDDGFDRTAGTEEAAPHGMPEVGRDWLEARFADIAARVEQSLHDIRPDNSFLALGRRFDQFEERFGSVLDGVATRSDVEGLRLVEAHINELAAQFEHAQAQLGRLDTIENQLHAVVERLAETALNHGPAELEHLVAEAADRAARRVSEIQQPAPDLGRLASAAAETAISRYAETVRPAPAAPAAPDRGVEKLRDLVEAFIAERRSGEENTATMLDTMQQAMIRVLDRIDAMELSHTHQPPAPAAPQEYVREQVRFGSPSDHMQRPVYEDARNAAQAAVAAAAGQMQPHASSPFSHVPSADVPATPVRMVPPEMSRAGAPTSPPPSDPPRPPMQGRATPERSKDDFVAAARRARRQVAGMPADLPPAAPAKTEPQLAVPAPTLKPPAAEKPAAKTKDTEGLSFFGIKRKSFLGGAVAVLAIMVASLMMPPKHVELSGNAIRIETPASPESTTADAAAAPADQPADTAAEAAASADALAAEVTAPKGITLQIGKDRPTPAQLEHLERQQAMATLSSRLGAAATTTAPTPISLVPEQPTAEPVTPAGVPGGEAPTAARAMQELPPATVGPLSLRIAAAKGDPSAQFEVGARLAEGKGTQQNFAEAIKWYQRSAQQGFAQAQYRIGTLYERGLGVKTDLARARVWYKRAADQGNVKAMHNLAVLSAGRQTGTPDYATAAQWFTEAAERGLADSQFNLAVLYESGLGVQKDLKQAYKWFAIAARAGDPNTVKRREQVRAQLPSAEMDAAEIMLRDWTSKPQEMMTNDARTAGEAWKQPAAQQAQPLPSDG